MKYPGKKLCRVCKLAYHPKEYDKCFDCFKLGRDEDDDLTKYNDYEKNKGKAFK